MTTKIRQSRLVACAAAVLTAIAGLAAFSASASANTFTATDTVSFAAAVASANTTPGPNTITVAAASYGPKATVDLTNKTGTLTVQGPSPVATTNGSVALFDGSSVQPPGTPLFKIESGVTVSFVGIAVTNGGGNGAPAIDDFGTANFTQSSIVGNTGSGLFVEPNAAATLVNSTFSDGLDLGVIDQGTATLTNTTVTRNTNGGIDNANGRLQLVNTIVANNGTSADCTAAVAAATSDHSLDSDSSCGVGALSGKDPKLAAINVVGGTTPTDPPAAGSPALDAGDPAACPAVDQRGAPRPDDAGTACDIGAVERYSVAPAFVSPGNITTSTSSSSGKVVTYTATFTPTGSPLKSQSCAPVSGSTFPIGTTTVNCTGTDSFANKGMGSFTVTVNQTDEPPTAAYTPSTFTPAQGQTVSFNGTASNDPDGSIVTYRWVWGDGTPDGSGPTPTHVFAMQGKVSVGLYVTDSSGQSVAVGHGLTVGDDVPTVAYTPSTYTPGVGQTVTFNGTASEPDGSIVTYRWVWGDGTPDGSGPTPTHVFTTTGMRSVGLYVTDSGGQMAAVGHAITVLTDDVPAGLFTPSTYTPLQGQTVSFDGTASSEPDGSIVTYGWVWGDGTPDGSGPTPTHAFTMPGTFKVAMTVTDSAGQTSVTYHSITVRDDLPTVAFTPSTYTPAVGQTVSFAGSANDPDGSIVTYRWVWGDGSPDGSGVTATHAFTSPGKRTVALYVTDSAGQTAVAGHSITAVVGGV